MVTAQVVDGTVQTGYTETTKSSETTSNNELGKEAFLQLLITQMQYQDPLDPQDNSEMLSQLAQFSALEEMQNVVSSLSNSQALSLVGKNVIIEVGKSSGSDNTTTVGGTVDYVQMVDGSAKLSINGSLYDYDDLDMVVDDAYLQRALQEEAD
jgi:flagellar basal-body rod modification protein FlgD